MTAWLFAVRIPRPYEALYFELTPVARSRGTAGTALHAKWWASE